MKLLTYEVDGRRKIGIWNREETWLYPLDSFGIEYRTMEEVIEGISESEIQLLNHMAKKIQTWSGERPLWGRRGYWLPS